VTYFIVRSLCLPEDHKDLSQVGMLSVRDVNQGQEYDSDQCHTHTHTHTHTL